MNRFPNPWVALPVALAAITGGLVGYFVTDASCTPDSCTVAAVSVALVVGIGSALGVGLVVVLALKSISEWREHTDRDILTVTDTDDPTPPTC